MKYKKIKGDLFTAPKDALFAHCVAVDARMSAGLARQFAAIYPAHVNYLRRTQENRTIGDIYVAEEEGLHNVVYMFTKPHSHLKPVNYDGLERCLEKVRDHALMTGRRTIAMPLIGAGFDAIYESGLEGKSWETIEQMTLDTFGETNIEVNIYYL